MSIQSLAQKLQSEGRNGDSLLVHMTPSEVGGLQALAKASGGSLTVNPKTGLVEANFLESILPTIFGIGLSFIPGVGPLAAGALVGGGTALATGNIEKGLLAGLGAYGGAGLGGAISAAGAPAAAASAMGVPGAATGAGSQAAMLAEQAAGFGTEGLENIASSAGYASGATPSVMGAGSQFSAGLGEIAKAPGAFLKSNLTNIGMAAAPMLAAGYSGEAEQPETEAEGNIREYEYSQAVNPNFGMPGQPYYTQTYTPGAVTPVSEYGYAEGGIAQIQGPYTRQQRPVDPAVGAYNQELMQRARQEYLQTQAPGAFRSALPNQGVYDPQAGAAFQQAQEARAAAAAEAAKTPSVGGYTYDAATQQFTQMEPTASEFEKLKEEMDRMRNEFGGGFNPYYSDSGGDGGFDGFDNPGNNPGNDVPGGQSDSPSHAAGGVIKKAPGGLASIAGGEFMKDGSFVIDARTVAELGNGSSNAGLELLTQLGGRPVEGPGDGVSDSIPATIDGTQDAAVARDEVIFTPQAVAAIGGGDAGRGRELLYEIMRQAEKARKKVDRGEDSGAGLKALSMAGAV
jgi:hypothetical protein